MKTLIDQLSQYADYHRDPRNVLTHFIGVPMILSAVVILLSRPVLWPPQAMGGLALSPAWFAALAATWFYLRLDRRYGLCMAAVLALLLWPGQWLAQQSLALWLGAGLGLFVLGWVIQFVGHYWEGRKPAFFDDVIGLLVGPLFVLAEMGFVLGLRREVQAGMRTRSRQNAGGAAVGG